jgi:hypothetical protein
MSEPSVGRIVHYVSYGTPGGEYESKCRAAVVTEIVAEPGVDGITPWRLSLAVLNPGGLFFDRGLPQSEDKHVGGTWHWPERVD